jgi:hypothetical protein
MAALIGSHGVVQEGRLVQAALGRHTGPQDDRLGEGVAAGHALQRMKQMLKLA